MRSGGSHCPLPFKAINLNCHPHQKWTNESNIEENKEIDVPCCLRITPHKIQPTMFIRWATLFPGRLSTRCGPPAQAVAFTLNTKTLAIPLVFLILPLLSVYSREREREKRRKS